MIPENPDQARALFRVLRYVERRLQLSPECSSECPCCWVFSDKLRVACVKDAIGLMEGADLNDFKQWVWNELSPDTIRWDRVEDAVAGVVDEGHLSLAHYER